MKKLFVMLLIFLNGCTITPKDRAWIIAQETSNPPGVNGNCLPVAQNLQTLYGGRIAILSHPDEQNYHAVLMVEEDRFLDNGTLGYGGHWNRVVKKGWKFSHWWTL